MPGVTSETTSAEYNASQDRESLARVFAKLDKKGDGKIDVDELYSYVKYLGHKCPKKEIEDMIWEVDENGDGCIQWEEFKVMFEHVKLDKTGWEPRSLYTVVEFMMVDKDCSGTVDIDECMEILYRRFGKNNLEEKVNEFMALDTDGEGTIGFSEFVAGMKKASQVPHPGFHFSQGIVKTTLEENKKILDEIYKVLPAKERPTEARKKSVTR